MFILQYAKSGPYDPMTGTVETTDEPVLTEQIPRASAPKRLAELARGGYAVLKLRTVETTGAGVSRRYGGAFRGTDGKAGA